MWQRLRDTAHPTHLVLPGGSRGTELEVEAGAALPHLVGEAPYPRVARESGSTGAVCNLKDKFKASFKLSSSSRSNVYQE